MENDFSSATLTRYQLTLVTKTGILHCMTKIEISMVLPFVQKNIVPLVMNFWIKWIFPLSRRQISSTFCEYRFRPRLYSVLSTQMIQFEMGIFLLKFNLNLMKTWRCLKTMLFEWCQSTRLIRDKLFHFKIYQKRNYLFSIFQLTKNQKRFPPKRFDIPWHILHRCHTFNFPRIKNNFAYTQSSFLTCSNLTLPFYSRSVKFFVNFHWT